MTDREIFEELGEEEWIRQNTELWVQAGYTLEEAGELAKASLIVDPMAQITAEEACTNLKDAMDRYNNQSN